MNVQDFLKKNIRYVLILFIALFLLKSFQSCNRNMTIKKLNKEIVYLNDSLTNTLSQTRGDLLKKIQIANDSIKELNYEVKLAKTKEAYANDRANAVQSTASKIRENTTIKIENNSYKDSISIKNK